ncbi:S-layer homology domain-containing protein [Candidatus Peregrinibacteria bacterium]|nr:S-layer homology domain-containing protein [Candidatus Peregrinibacteria bacterium]
MKNRQFTAGGIVFTLLTTLIPLTAQAGGSSFSISELNPQTRTIQAGENNQLIKELEVSLYNEDISSLNDMEFSISCQNRPDFSKVSVGQGSKTLGESTFIDISANATEKYAHVTAAGSEIKNGVNEKFWVKVDVTDTDKSNAYVCQLTDFSFIDPSKDIRYGSERSYEEVASGITPIVVMGSSKSGPIKSVLEVDMKKLGDLTYKLGSQNQLIYMADVTANQDLTIDDILFSCQNSYSLENLTLKDQTAKKILREGAPNDNFSPMTPDYFPPIQSELFTNLDWQIRGGSTRQLNILADFKTTSWSSEYKHGCSIMAINAHIIDPTNTSKNISIHPTQIPGIGLQYQTGPLNISQDFIDIPKDDFLYDAVIYLRNAYIVDGYDDGMFRPLSKINRAEFAQMLTKVKTQGVLVEYDVNCSKEDDPNFFSDVAEGVWYNLPICYSYHMKFIKGYADGTFKPEKNVSRAEAIKMALKVAGIEIADEPTTGPWYTPYIEPAGDNGLLYYDPGLGNPDEEITRGEMAMMLYRVLNNAKDLALKEAINAKVEILKTQTGERYVAGDYYAGIGGDFQLACTETAFQTFEETMALIAEYNEQNQANGNLNNYDIYNWTSENPMLAVLFGLNPDKLHIATNSGCVEIAKNYLTQDSSKLNDTTGYSGKTPLIIAVDNQDQPMVEMLLAQGADPNKLTADNYFSPWPNLSPLYFAAIHNNTTLIQKLLDAEANINQTLKTSSTVLDLAVLESSEETQTYLKDHGAKTYIETVQ